MRAVCLSAGLFFVAILSSPSAGAGPHATEPAVSVRYRGSPPGSPQLDELAAIRVIGFEAITWPERHAAAVAAVRKMADVVGLQVEVRPDAVPLSAAAARTPGAHVDVPAGRDFRMLTPLVWRAVAYGARSIAFDDGGR